MADALDALQALIDRSTRTATASVAESIAFPDRQMTAAQLMAFWKDARMSGIEIALRFISHVGRNVRNILRNIRKF